MGERVRCEGIPNTDGGRYVWRITRLSVEVPAAVPPQAYPPTAAYPHMTSYPAMQASPAAYPPATTGAAPMPMYGRPVGQASMVPGATAMAGAVSFKLSALPNRLAVIWLW